MNTPNPPLTAVEKAEYQHSTYEIVSKIAYLIGVPKRIFDNEYEPPQVSVYRQLETDKNARIVRNLCIARTAIERNYKHISETMKGGLYTIYSMPDTVPTECLRQLADDGARFIKPANTKLYQHVVEINRLLLDRINNVRNLFPTWLNWEYIKDLFLMPDGLTEEGTKIAAKRFYGNMKCYPYQMYINWFPAEEGNILFNDKKFVTLLYSWNGDRFTEYSKVSDVSYVVKGTIYDFIEEANKILLLVDCENSDPYKLSVTLKGLDETSVKKIQKIILFDDVHTTSAWSVLDQFVSVPVERLLVERIKSNKSQVDMQLASRTFREFYENQVDSFILVSSDSDYWALINNLPRANFLVMVEREKCGPDLKRALADSGIFYCYLDDFYSGSAEDLKLTTLFRELYKYLDRSIHVNINRMMDEVLWTTRISMTDSEKQQFIRKHIRNMSLVIDSEGNVSLELKK